MCADNLDFLYVSSVGIRKVVGMAQLCSLSGGDFTVSQGSFQISRKSIERSSPFPSPSRLTRSPLLKAQKRVRTEPKVGCYMPKHLLNCQYQPTYQHRRHATVLNLSDFVPNSDESQSQHDLQCEMNAYVAHRVALHSSGLKYPFLGLQGFYALI